MNYMYRHDRDVGALLGSLQLGRGARVRDYVAPQPEGCAFGKRGMDWIACQLKPPCTVFSVGVGDEWNFEQLVLEQGCEVHSFDPTIALRKKHEAKAAALSAKYGGRLHFHCATDHRSNARLHSFTRPRTRHHPVI